MRYAIAAFLLVAAMAQCGTVLGADAQPPAEAEHGNDRQPKSAEDSQPPAGQADDRAPAVTIPPDQTATNDPAGSQPLNLWADQIVYEGDSFTCTGNVVLTRGDSRIDCDKIVGTLGEVEREDNETGQKRTEKAITSLVATGSPIRMVSGERRATCQQAAYDLATGKIVLTGAKDNPPELIIDKGRSARGERIIFMIDEKPIRVIIERGGNVVIPIPDGKDAPGKLDEIFNPKQKRGSEETK